MGLVAHYLALPDNRVVAGVRNPSHPTCQALSTLPNDPSSSLVIVQIESASKSSALAAMETLQAKYEIDTLDIVIANAGISTAYPTVADASVGDMENHYLVNVIGPVLLFQATRPLLYRSTVGKFAVMSSSAGTIGDSKDFQARSSSCVLLLTQCDLNHETRGLS